MHFLDTRAKYVFISFLSILFFPILVQPKLDYLSEIKKIKILVASSCITLGIVGITLGIVGASS